MLSFASDNPGPGFADVLPDRRTMSLRAHQTFLKPPEPGFAPRPLDPRIGFIPQPYKDHTAPFTEPIRRCLASRWRLVKKDPLASVSEPVEPIVFHLGRGMPEPERTAVRDAALWWNHAFEAAGFRNALVVRDLPEGATSLDARHSGTECRSRQNHPRLRPGTPVHELSVRFSLAYLYHRFGIQAAQQHVGG